MQERLKQQKEEAASNPEYGKSFKGKVSKEDKQAKRKQILSNIGAHCPSLFFHVCGEGLQLSMCSFPPWLREAPISMLWKMLWHYVNMQAHYNETAPVHTN